MVVRSSPRRRVLGTILASVVAIGSVSCTTLWRPGENALGSAGDLASGIQAWGRVLGQHVDGRGRVDFAAIAREPRDLELFVSVVGRISPRSNPDQFPGDNTRLAYYVNSFNALAMYGVIRAGIPPDFDGIFARWRFFRWRKFLVGGEQTSLHDYAQDVIAKLGEPRVFFAINRMTVGCPRLPARPFTATLIDRELDSAASEFLNNPKNVRVDGERKVVSVADLVSDAAAAGLGQGDDGTFSAVTLINKSRREKIPENYEVNFAEHDWSINKP